MNRYTVYVNGNWFAEKEAANNEQAIQMVRDQIKQLHPLNMSNEGAIEYRKRYENKPITANLRYKV